MNEISLPNISVQNDKRDVQPIALNNKKVAIAFGAAGLLLFLVMLVSYLTNSMLFLADEPVRRFFDAQKDGSSEFVVSTFRVFETLGSDGLTVGSIFFILMFLVRRKWRPFTMMFVAIAGMELTWLGWLYLVGRPRPEEVISKFSESSLPSFPSGHTMFFVTFFTTLLYIYLPRVESKRLRIAIITAVIALMLMTGWIRMFFGAHYFTDVLAGYGWGLFWAVASILGVEYYFERRLQESESL